jgi:hypothetical protein
MRDVDIPLKETHRIDGGWSSSLRYEDQFIAVILGGCNTTRGNYKVVRVDLRKLGLRVQGSDELHGVISIVLAKTRPLDETRGVALLAAVMEYVITEIGWQAFMTYCERGVDEFCNYSYQRGQRQARTDLNTWLHGDGVHNLDPSRQRVPPAPPKPLTRSSYHDAGICNHPDD